MDRELLGITTSQTERENSLISLLLARKYKETGKQSLFGTIWGTFPDLFIDIQIL